MNFGYGLKIGLLYNPNIAESHDFKRAVHMYELKKNSEGVYTNDESVTKLNCILYVSGNRDIFISDFPSGITKPNVIFHFEHSQKAHHYLETIEAFGVDNHFKLIDKISNYDGIYYEFYYEENTECLALNIRFEDDVDSPFKTKDGIKIAACDFDHTNGNRFYTFGFGKHAKELVSEITNFDGGVINPFYSDMREALAESLSPYVDLIIYLTSNPGFSALERLLIDGDLSIISNNIILDGVIPEGPVELNVNIKQVENERLGIFNKNILVEFFLDTEGDSTLFKLHDFNISSRGYVEASAMIGTKDDVILDVKMHLSEPSERIKGNDEVLQMIAEMLRQIFGSSTLKISNKRA